MFWQSLNCNSNATLRYLKLNLKLHKWRTCPTWIKGFDYLFAISHSTCSQQFAC